MLPSPPGRRERKKAATRQAIADAALHLFLERGFEAVGVREVAEAADVSTTTLFKHFPSKEALLFDEGDEREAALLAAIESRRPDQSVLQALLEQYLSTWRHRALDPRLVEFEALIHSVPTLVEYARRLNQQLEGTLARAIAASCDRSADDAASRALARFVLEAPALARGTSDPEQALREIFALLDEGWGKRTQH